MSLRGGCGEPSMPGWLAGPGCSCLAVEEGLGRWGLRWALHHAEPPMQGGKMSPSTLPHHPRAWTDIAALQAPAALAAAAPWCMGRDQQ